MRSSRSSGNKTGDLDRDQAQERQCHLRHRPAGLSIVGIGPGDDVHLSGRARQVLNAAEVVVGYRTYIDLIRPLIAEKRIVATAMTQEVERVNAALEEALAGRRVVLVSSGDPGIYAMAGLALELCATRRVAAAPAWAEAQGLAIEVVPGIPALCAGAALLGAPLTHDFAAISLSDLLTPWETIAKRLAAAAQADFVIVIYNPKSRKRDWQLAKAQAIILAHRDGATPVGIVTGAMRPDQRIVLTTLAQLHAATVDMQTTVFIGNTTTRRWGDFIFTPRGYDQKYAMEGRAS
jgi:precorrin-3B C17-methyltransferase